jgi:hypothetical protein
MWMDKTDFSMNLFQWYTRTTGITKDLWECHSPISVLFSIKIALKLIFHHRDNQLSSFLVKDNKFAVCTKTFHTCVQFWPRRLSSWRRNHYNAIDWWSGHSFIKKAGTSHRATNQETPPITANYKESWPVAGASEKIQAVSSMNPLLLLEAKKFRDSFWASIWRNLSSRRKRWTSLETSASNCALNWGHSWRDSCSKS